MATPKKEHFKKEDIKVARIAKALSHPARIAILRHLASLETCSFSDISNELPLAGSTVSQHMTELKDAGLINGRSEPPKIQYSIDYDNWKAARKCLRQFTKIKVAKNESA